MQWCCVSYTESLRLLRQRRNGKKPGRNISTGGEYLTVFVGRASFDDVRQERGTLLSIADKRGGMLDDCSAGQKRPERNGIIL